MTASKSAEKLCIEAEKLGLCHPTEGMIADRMNDILSNQIQEIDYELRSAGFQPAAEFLERLFARQCLERQEQEI